MADLPRERGARGDELHARPEHPLEHRAHERIVRAAEDHRVDVRLAQRPAVAAHGVDEALVEREAALDDRREVGARHGRQRHVRVDGGERLGVGAAVDGRRRGKQPDAPGLGGRRGLHGLRAHDPEHVDAQRRLHHPPPQRGHRRRRRRVARDDEQLRAARQERLGDPDGERLELLATARAVRKARRVAEVQEVLVRKRHEQLVQDREAADAGVEDADRTGARICAGGHGGSQADRPHGTAAVLSAHPSRSGCPS